MYTSTILIRQLFDPTIGRIAHSKDSFERLERPHEFSLEELMYTSTILIGQLLDPTIV